jgi:signal transduction histidine kinase
MESNAAIAGPVPPEIEQLSELFEKFNESSRSLQASYSVLMNEADALRAQLRAKEMEVKRAERLATLGETAAAMAHEVRNPLGALKLLVSVLKEEVADRPNAKMLTEEISRSIESIDGVVSNILHFAKDCSLKRSFLNLGALVQEIGCQFRTLSRGEMKVSVNVRQETCILGAEDALRRALYNLCLNAAQATQFKGDIEVLLDRDADGTAVLTIKDNGPGIAEDLLPTIFEPFVTTKSEGTGLGLAIVRRIIEQHEGSIEAVNAGGACFTLKFPAP